MKLLYIPALFLFSVSVLAMTSAQKKPLRRRATSFRPLEKPKPAPNNIVGLIKQIQEDVQGELNKVERTAARAQRIQKIQISTKVVEALWKTLQSSNFHQSIMNIAQQQVADAHFGPSEKEFVKKMFESAKKLLAIDWGVYSKQAQDFSVQEEAIYKSYQTDQILVGEEIDEHYKKISLATEQLKQDPRFAVYKSAKKDIDEFSRLYGDPLTEACLIFGSAKSEKDLGDDLVGLGQAFVNGVLAGLGDK